MLQKMTYYAPYELIIYVKQKCYFYFRKGDFLLIFVNFYASFPSFWQIFATRIRIRIIYTVRIRVAETIWIRSDPDPQFYCKSDYRENDLMIQNNDF